MKHDFRCFFPLQCSKAKSSPKLWVTIILTALIIGGMALDYCRVAEYLNESIQMFEVPIMFFSYRVTFMFFVFGLCLILSDAPFWDENTIYYLSRMSGSRWMLCVSKYTFLMSTLYTMFIIIAGMLFSAGRLTFSLNWSAPAKAIASYEIQIGQGQGIFFDEAIISVFSPCVALIKQSLLIVLYGYLLGMIVTAFNIRFKSSAGFVVAVSVHALMLVISLDNLPILGHLSLYNYASLTSQQSMMPFVQAVLILLFADLGITWLGFRSIRHADISTTTMEWIS